MRRDEKLIWNQILAILFLTIVMIISLLGTSGTIVHAAEKAVVKKNSISINSKQVKGKTNKVKDRKISKKAKKALAAYKKCLSRKKVDWYDGMFLDADQIKFSVVDINKDGVPELLLNNEKCSGRTHLAGYEGVFYLTGKKVEFLCARDEIRYYYPKSGIVEMYRWGMGNSIHYYEIKNGKAEEIGGVGLENDTSISKNSKCTWKGKSVLGSEFKSILKKEAGKKVKITDSFWHTNTSQNRANMTKLVKW